MKNRALILVQGRGATAEGIRTFATGKVTVADDFVILAPQAPGNTWYPFRFIEPKEKNEPYLSEALGVLDGLVRDLGKQRIAPEPGIFFGFSQGACLIAEYLKQNPRRYGGAVIASGGVIGTEAEAEESMGSSTLSGTPVYLGCDHADAHIPEASVLLTERLLNELGADVEMHLYDGLGHAVHADAFVFLSDRIKRS